MRRSDFDYPLPPELIAQQPLPQRADSRLLVLDGATGDCRDTLMRELPQLLAPGDLLVFNDTRVLPARLHGRKQSGGKVEILLERPLAGARALVQLRPAKSLRPGMQVLTDGGPVEAVVRHGELWELALPADAVEFFERHGLVPLPPYIGREPQAADRERYQSLFARVPGAVAAPTASLHFDAPLLEALAARGLGRALVTLHVGAGTFQPLRHEDVDAHVMHAERYDVGAAAVEAIRRTRAAGGRVIAVGTTVARALEAAAAAAEPPAAAPAATATVAATATAVGTGAGQGAAAGVPQDGFAGLPAAGQGETALFIRPGYRFRVIDALLTNFHLPQSTLLMLVAAFAGREHTLAAYAHAVAARYRFFSYGDAMLVWPDRQARYGGTGNAGGAGSAPGSPSP